MNVISLAERKAESQPHMHGDAKCVGCQHEWVAVASVGTDILECPSCGLDKGVFAHMVTRGEQVFQCNCGNDLFRIAPEIGPYCVNCATPAVGWFE